MGNRMRNRIQILVFRQLEQIAVCLTSCCIFAKIRLGELHSLRIQGYASVDS